MSNQQPLISIDVVPLRFNSQLGKVEFATGARLFEPFLGEQALPGVLLQAGESINEAAARALESKVGLLTGELRQLGAFDARNRDPRGANISITLLSAQDSFAVSDDAHWHSESLELPFDHALIVAKAFEKLTEAVWKDISLTRKLLGDSFTTADATALGSPTPLSSNARRWFETWPHVCRSENQSKTGTVGRPAATWEWIDS